MSLNTEIEDIQLELQGLLVTLSKERLIEPCAKFKLAAENFQDKTQLNLTKLLFSAIENELGKLRDEEIVPYLNDVIQVQGWRQGRARGATAPPSEEASPPVGAKQPICRSKH